MVVSSRLHAPMIAQESALFEAAGLAARRQAFAFGHFIPFSKIPSILFSLQGVAVLGGNTG
ncbi:MAG: hypothetical protein Q8O79_04460 [Pseudomonadota bacterium]|nr:hypothetical protein [Pseudomonadota bacterium]